MGLEHINRNSRMNRLKLVFLLSSAAIIFTDGHYTPVAAQEQDTTIDDVTFLDKIIIGGEKFVRDIFTTYTSVDVITSDELDNYSANTIDEALNRSANVRSFETGEGRSSFVIRGLNAEGVTQPSRSAPVISVTVDGAPH